MKTPEEVTGSERSWGEGFGKGWFPKRERAVPSDVSTAKSVFEDGLKARRQRSTPQDDAGLPRGDERF
jgi:hypothetical protein